MLAVRLDKPLEERLEKLADKTGRTKTWYAEPLWGQTYTFDIFAYCTQLTQITTA